MQSAKKNKKIKNLQEKSKNLLTNPFSSAIIICVRNAAMAQLVERVLGKDEVSGPNPDSSSRKPRREFVGALVLYRSLAELLPGSGSEKNFGANIALVHFA